MTILIGGRIFDKGDLECGGAILEGFQQKGDHSVASCDDYYAKYNSDEIAPGATLNLLYLLR